MCYLEYVSARLDRNIVHFNESNCDAAIELIIEIMGSEYEVKSYSFKGICKFTNKVFTHIYEDYLVYIPLTFVNFKARYLLLDVLEIKWLRKARGVKLFQSFLN